MAFGPAMQKQRLMKEGVPGTATILGMQETGVSMQGGLYFLVKFVLQVTPKGRSPYQVETKSMVSRLTIAQFQPGAVISVMIDPNDPQKVAMMDQTSASAGMGGAQQAQLQMLQQIDTKNKQILASGVSAKAKILTATPMGININGPNPAMTFDVQVQPQGQPPFTAQCKGVIGAPAVAKFQPGKMLFVKYNPSTFEATIERSA
ncbi:MAG: hypothetical protein ABIA67_06765, partial [Candidatus Margulisiibacteriota bacterium]